MAPPDPAALQDPTKKKPRTLDEILSGLDSTTPDGKAARTLDDILKQLGEPDVPEPKPPSFFDRANEFLNKDRAPATREFLGEAGNAIKEGILHPIDTAESLIKSTVQPVVSAVRPLSIEQGHPEAPRAFGSATTGAPEPFELEQRALDPGITGKEKLIGTAGTVGMIIAGPMEGKMANALVQRWGGEVASAAIRTMGVRRAYQMGIVTGQDIAKVVGAHTIASSVAGAEAGAMINPEEPVKGALAGAVAGPILRGGGAVARGASRELGLAERRLAEHIRARRGAGIPDADFEVVKQKLLRPGMDEAKRGPTAPPEPPPTRPTAPPEPKPPTERRELPRAEGDVWTPEQRSAYVTTVAKAFSATKSGKPWSQWTDAEKDAYFAGQAKAKTEAAAGRGALPAPASTAAPEVVRVKTSDIHRDPERFQFKQGLGEEGVSRELKSTQRYNPQLAGVIGTWIDPANGKEYVVNGHHRDELAKRTGYPYQNAMRIQAQTPEEARSIGALMNIAEGRGTPVDVAKFLRDTKLDTSELEKQGISLRGDLARKGVAISKLAPDVFARVASEEIPIGHAVQLGEMLPDEPELQRETLKAIASSGKRLTESEVREVARQVRDAGSEAVNQETLFGTQTENRPLYVERGQIAASLLKKLSTDRRVLGFVSKQGRPEVLSKAGNKIDVERSKAMADQSAQLEEVFQRLYTRGGPIANLLTDAARKVASGKNIRAVSDELYPAVTEAIRQALPGSGGTPGTHGVVPQEERPVAGAEDAEGEVKPYTSTDEAQEGMFERPPKYGDNANTSSLRALWDRSGPNGRLNLLAKWRKLFPADEFHRGRVFPPHLAKMELEDLPDHVRDALGSERAAEVSAMGELGIRENRPTYAGSGSLVAGAEHLWSALGRRIEAAPFEKGTAEQWAAHLNTGVSKGEKEFTGIDRFLKENAGKPITKERVQQEFDKRRIRLEETKLPSRQLTTGGWTQEQIEQYREAALVALRRNDNLGFDTTQQAMAAVAQNIGDFPDRWEFDNPADIEAVRRYARIVNHQLLPEQRAQPAQYQQYTEPGGENYREILVQLAVPPEQLYDPAKLQIERFDLGRHTQPGVVLKYDGERLGQYDSKVYIGNGEHKELPDSHWHEIARELVGSRPSTGTFNSGHFAGRKNILGHLRVDDRTYGKDKVLFAEEFQSDWHQKGRKHGYSSEVNKRLEEVTLELEKYEGKSPTELGWDAEKLRHIANLQQERAKLVGQTRTAVPDGPFKKTEEWLGLLMKRLLDEAVRGNYDRIAWTNGDQQASRYDLSKHVSAITYEPKDGFLEAWRGGSLVHQGRYDPRALEDVIGKEAAEKLLATPLQNRLPEGSALGDRKYHTLEGLDLKIGGEGMRAFYDKMAPKVALAIGKELGVKVEIQTLPIIAAQKNVALTADDVREFGQDSRRPTITAILESTAAIMEQEDEGWMWALDQAESNDDGGWTSADYESAHSFLQSKQDATNAHHGREEPRSLTADHIGQVVERTPRDTHRRDLLEKIEELMRDDENELHHTSWREALEVISDSGLVSSDDVSRVRDTLEQEEHTLQNQAEEPDDSLSTLTDHEVADLAMAEPERSDLRILLSEISNEMADEGDNWSDIFDALEANDRVNYPRQVWREAMERLRAADAAKLAARSRENTGQPGFKITPELKAAVGKGMRMMESTRDLFGGGEPEQTSLLPSSAGRSVPQATPGGFTAKQREAKEKADFLRKQLPRITDAEKRIKVASEIASLDRIANFAEKVKPTELQARAEAEKPIEPAKDTGTGDLFAERRAKTSRDPEQRHLELTFGSVAKAQAVVDDLVKNAAGYVTSASGEALSGKDRLWNLKTWEKNDSLFQLEQRDELHPSAWVTLKGKTVHNSTDVARLLHAFRSPRAERLHFILTDDAGTILDHQIDSSGAINYVQFQDDYADRILRAAKAVGATKVILGHNHPSGDPTPSEEDRRVTVMMEQHFRGTGLELREHVVIDHGKFSQIKARPMTASESLGSSAPGGGTIVDQGLNIPVKPDFEDDWTQGHGMQVILPSDVAAVVLRSSPLSRGFAVMYLSTQHEVIALEPHGTKALKDIEKWLPDRVKELAAHDVIIVHQKKLTQQVTAPNGRTINQEMRHFMHEKAEAHAPLGRVVLDVMAFDGTDSASQVYGAPISGHAYYSEELVPARRVLEKGAGDESMASQEGVSEGADERNESRSLTYGHVSPADFGARTLPRQSVREPAAGGAGQPPSKPPGKGRAVAALPPEEPQGGAFGVIRKALAPAGRTAQSAITARALREHLAKLAHANELAVEKLKKYRKSMGKLTIPERYDWIDAVETGQIARIKDPELRTAAQLVRTLLDNARDDVINLGTGKLEQWIENYFPHIWKSGDTGIIGKILGRRPFEGPKSFLKHRTIPTTKEGLAAGLEPVTDNPFDLALLRLREMNRYVAAHRFIQEMKDRNLIQFVKAGALPPQGYAAIDDKIGTVFGKAEVKLPNGGGVAHLGGILIRGAYFGPEPVVTVINNHLAPGLRGNPLYDAYAGIGNVLNQSQLGLSAFHLGFTTADATISNMALAIEQLAAGHFRQGAFRLLTTPAAPFTTFLKGHKMHAEYFNPQNNQMAALLDALTAGGGRVRMDSFYRTSYLPKFLEEMKHRDPKALLHLYPALLELASKPILEWIVPRQKLGVFAQLAEFEMSRLPKGATRDDVRRVMAEAWDAVDNRMGQLVYDNLFWKRTLKDAAMGSFRSVGWNVGTFRTVGTGLLDIGRIPYESIKGGKPPKMTRDLAYVMGLTFFVIVADSILNYLMTGKMPHGRDFFAPQTGTKNDEGNPDRVVLPTYMKDIIGYAEHPWETIKHKLNPAIEAVNEMLENKDFYSVQIRNPDDPIVKQLKQELEFFVKLIEPFGFRNAREQKKRGQGVGVRAANYIGITPANRAMTRTKAQNKIMEFLGAESPSMTTPEDRAKREARHELRGAKAEHKPLGEAKAAARAAGLTKKEIQKTVTALPTGDIWLDRFKKLSYPQMKIVFDLASEDEQRRWRFRYVEKRRAYTREHGHQPAR